MSIEETAKALDNAIAVYVMAVARDASTGATATSSGAREQMKAAIRAYGAARELKGHVDACSMTTPWGEALKHCGDDWLCDVAREIEERR